MVSSPMASHSPWAGSMGCIPVVHALLRVRPCACLLAIRGLMRAIRVGGRIFCGDGWGQISASKGIPSPAPGSPLFAGPPSALGNSRLKRCRHSGNSPNSWRLSSTALGAIPARRAACLTHEQGLEDPRTCGIRYQALQKQGLKAACLAAQ